MRTHGWKETVAAEHANPGLRYGRRIAAHPITFGVQAGLESKRQLLDVARQAEAQGFAFLTVADHPGSMASPFPTLAAVAAVTESIHLGPYVANAGLRRPIDLAVDAATLDVLSDGRAFLGLGAGHTPAEWSSQGMSRPKAADRVGRLIETADAVARLLAGERVTVDGDYVTLDEAVLDQPRPVQERIPLLVGGNNQSLLRYAGAHADVVALSGLGRTLPDGHRHEVKWSAEQIDSSMSIVEAATRGRSLLPVRQALVQVVIVTNERDAKAADVASRIGTAVDVILETPYVMIGTIEQMVEQVEANRERWGISSYIVREPMLEAITKVIEKLGS